MYIVCIRINILCKKKKKLHRRFKKKDLNTFLCDVQKPTNTLKYTKYNIANVLSEVV